MFCRVLGGVPPTGNYGPRKCISIDKVRLSVEEALGNGPTDVRGCNESGEARQGRQERCRGVFEIEADGISGQQVRYDSLRPTQSHFGRVVAVSTGASWNGAVGSEQQTGAYSIAVFGHQNYSVCFRNAPCKNHRRTQTPLSRCPLLMLLYSLVGHSTSPLKGTSQAWSQRPSTCFLRQTVPCDGRVAPGFARRGARHMHVVQG